MYHQLRGCPTLRGSEAWAPPPIVSRDFSYPKHNFLRFIHEHHAALRERIKAIAAPFPLLRGVAQVREPDLRANLGCREVADEVFRDICALFDLSSLPLGARQGHAIGACIG